MSSLRAPQPERPRLSPDLATGLTVGALALVFIALQVSDPSTGFTPPMLPLFESDDGGARQPLIAQALAFDLERRRALAEVLDWSPQEPSRPCPRTVTDLSDHGHFDVVSREANSASAGPTFTRFVEGVRAGSITSFDPATWDAEVTLFIDELVEPVPQMTAGEASRLSPFRQFKTTSGRLKATALLYDFKRHRVVCAAQVEVSGDKGLELTVPVFGNQLTPIEHRAITMMLTQQLGGLALKDAVEKLVALDDVP